MEIHHRGEFGTLLNEHGCRIGAELGVAKGAFSNCLLERSRLSLLVSIDRWSDHHNDREYRSVLELLRRHGDRSHVLRMTFDAALPLFPDGYFDFIYIDGYAHTGQEGGRTLARWWPKLRQGGVFAGHDYAKTYAPTMRAVDEFVEEFSLALHTTREQLASWWVVK